MPPDVNEEMNATAGGGAVQNVQTAPDAPYKT